MLSPKTIRNVHTALSGLRIWGVEEGFVSATIERTRDPPDPKAPVVETLTKEEIDALLAACDRSKTWKNRQISANERPAAARCSGWPGTSRALGAQPVARHHLLLLRSGIYRPPATIQTRRSSKGFCVTVRMPLFGRSNSAINAITRENDRASISIAHVRLEAAMPVW